MKGEPLRFFVSSLKNIGQKTEYENINGEWEHVPHGPWFVRVGLMPMEGMTDNEQKTEIKLTLTHDVAERFNLNSTVELWPTPKPRTKKQERVPRKIRVAAQE